MDIEILYLIIERVNKPCLKLMLISKRILNICSRIWADVFRKRNANKVAKLMDKYNRTHILLYNHFVNDEDYKGCTVRDFEVSIRNDGISSVMIEPNGYINNYFRISRYPINPLKKSTINYKYPMLYSNELNKKKNMRFTCLLYSHRKQRKDLFVDPYGNIVNDFKTMIGYESDEPMETEDELCKCDICTNRRGE